MIRAATLERRVSGYLGRPVTAIARKGGAISLVDGRNSLFVSPGRVSPKGCAAVLDHFARR